jgi:hypothetical protein
MTDEEKVAHSLSLAYHYALFACGPRDGRESATDPEEIRKAVLACNGPLTRQWRAEVAVKMAQAEYAKNFALPKKMQGNFGSYKGVVARASFVAALVESACQERGVDPFTGLTSGKLKSEVDRVRGERWVAVLLAENPADVATWDQVMVQALGAAKKLAQ